MHVCVLLINLHRPQTHTHTHSANDSHNSVVSGSAPKCFISASLEWLNTSEESAKEMLLGCKAKSLLEQGTIN